MYTLRLTLFIYSIFVITNYFTSKAKERKLNFILYFDQNFESSFTSININR